MNIYTETLRANGLLIRTFRTQWNMSLDYVAPGLAHMTMWHDGCAPLHSLQVTPLQAASYLRMLSVMP